ncbi:MAG: hypothetical protein ACLQT5_08315 [Steroidobacteraceae bacterium]|jgi:hypothetical protein
MTDAKLRILAVGTMLGLAMAAHAQQSTDAAKSLPSAPAAAAAATPADPAASASTASPVVVVHTTMSTAVSLAPDAPSPDLLKAAREAGYHTRVKKGVTLFCKYDAVIGTHLKTENCFNENTTAEILRRDQLQRDQFSHIACAPGGGACGGGR